MKILYGFCVGGPKDRGTMANENRRVKLPGGAYIYVPAAGVTPAQWKWYEDKK